MPPAERERLYVEGGADWIRTYRWVTKFFNGEWAEPDLKWFAYDNYESYLDEELWILHASPDFDAPVALSATTLYLAPTRATQGRLPRAWVAQAFRLKVSFRGSEWAHWLRLIAFLLGNGIKRNGHRQTHLVFNRPTVTQAPTHLRVILHNAPHPVLMYTLPRSTTFEALKELVESDLSQKGCFNKYDVGPPDNIFGPKKSFNDVFPPTTAGVSHTWQ